MNTMETTNFATSTAPLPTAWRELSDLPDDGLVERAREHNLAAFEALMRRHSRRLFRVARGVLRDSDAAQDAVQEACLRAFRRLDTYQPEARFSTWLTRMAFDEALMIRRRDHAGTGSLGAAAEAVAQETAASVAPAAEQFMEAVHARELLEHAIDGLPENFRLVFMLRAVEGLDVRDTSESLGVNANTVRTRLFRAQRILRGDLSRRLQTESSEAFDFGAERCNAVVANVLARLAA